MEEDTKPNLNSTDDEERAEDSEELSDEELGKVAGGGAPSHLTGTGPNRPGVLLPPGPPC
jgi:hypothetical protein